MNFLAHVYLSGNDPQLMIGNFIGDFVKGRNLNDRYNADIVKGIELHRAIDEFTDQHEVVLNSKVRLRPKYRHYSGVIVDMYYDHFLAKNWNDFHDISLQSFASQFYALLKENESILPKEVLYMMPYMIKGNWFVNYAQKDGIHRALTGMSRRTSFDSKMDEAIEDLSKHYTLFENEFLDFFPSLKTFSNDWIKAY
ncbi:MAG TPA: DUF479 domain-containing protein [Cytophagales bacterium]|nr:DUF479 domain-containing protein [Cytophagales bacterium]